MSSGGDFYLGDRPSYLTYKIKICPKCGHFTTIRVSRSRKNANKLYYCCDTHGFVGWCLPTNVGTVNPCVEEKSDEKREMDHDIKIALKNKLLGITASCKRSSISSLLYIVVLAIAFVAVTL